MCDCDFDNLKGDLGVKIEFILLVYNNFVDYKFCFLCLCIIICVYIYVQKDV